MTTPQRDLPAEVEQQYAQVCSKISKEGICMVSFPSTGELAPVTFTVGAAAKALPDLIVYGLPFEIAPRTLNNAHVVLSENWPFENKTRFHGVLDGYEVAFRDVSKSDLFERVMFLAALFNTRQRLKPTGIRQVCWPDQAGKFPFEPGCDGNTAAIQRVRGLRS